MQQSDLPLYPKTLSIYNKILQLGIAVILVVVIFSFWFTSFSQTKDEISIQFESTAQSFVQQAVVTVKVMLKNDRAAELKEFINSLDQAPLVHEARLYDTKGNIIAQTDKSQSVKQLFGLESEIDGEAEEFVPFVSEIRTDKLLGYLRINLRRKSLTEPLDVKIEEQTKSVNLMIILAGIAGFLLTKGLSKFSRHNMAKGKPSEE